MTLRKLNPCLALRVALLLLLFCTFAGAARAAVVTGDRRTALYMPLLKGKRVALFSNHTGMAGRRHILDVLIGRKVNVACIFSPEHGFRGSADAGEKVAGSRDEKTGVPIVSLYGNPAWREDAEALGGFDVLVADIQDVGLRFYTYYVTLCHLMDYCNLRHRQVVVLDRPNPNGFYVDGPVLDMKYRSGVGWLPVPVVHGLTLGELALMASGEGWLEGGRRCALTVVPCRHYTHHTRVDITIPPSPNLPNLQAVLLYPSLCFFEATPVSVGRGTDKPFQVFGHPKMEGYPYRFTPESRMGAKNPPQKGNVCYGRDLSHMPEDSIKARGLDLSYLIEAYNVLNMGDAFFSPFFEKLMGNGSVRGMIEKGMPAAGIRQTWQKDVEAFKKQRRPYLLYPE
jgi:uncharacterized protein YbbC (DUF1343 family)